MNDTITNYDIQQMLLDTTKLKRFLKDNEDVKQGAGYVAVHKWALIQIISELVYHRDK